MSDVVGNNLGRPGSLERVHHRVLTCRLSRLQPQKASTIFRHNAPNLNTRLWLFGVMIRVSANSYLGDMAEGFDGGSLIHI